ncbi:MAG: ribosomal-processing cysteine protease Prp [Spirochaetales bacterium]|nr:ribosomal-processing cysteine protease Prp [Spirochaetales bacterium]
MIRVSVETDGGGCLRRLQARGHSFARDGYSPACAAVSCLLRTAGELFGAEGAADVRISLPAEGNMDITVGEIPLSLGERFRGITDFLVIGLARISEEAPEDLFVQVSHIK